MIIVEEDTQATPENITAWIKKHKRVATKFKLNHEYYEGQHSLLKRPQEDNKPNNKPIINLAKYISVMATNYLVGKQVEYSYKGDAQETFNKILDLYKRQSIAKHDKKVAKATSISGVGYELSYMSSDDQPVPKVAQIDESEAEIVCDNTVENNCLYGLHFFLQDNKKSIVEVYDDFSVTTYFGNGRFENLIKQGEEIHGFDRVPLTEFINNDEKQGDFEQVIQAIDSYEKIFAEEINDIEAFNAAILMLYNTNFYEGNQQQFDDRIKQLKKDRVLEFTSKDQAAAWLTKMMDQSKISVLAASLRSDIHAVSFVPNLTDVNFANNSSGVAMQYKLIGFEALTSEKQSYFEQCLRRRLKLFAGALEILGYAPIDVQDITITFKRSLPRNDVEMASIIAQVDGRNIVDKETMAKQLSFYNEDVKDNLAKEKAEQPSVDYASINNPNLYNFAGLNNAI